MTASIVMYIMTKHTTQNEEPSPRNVSDRSRMEQKKGHRQHVS